MVTIKKFDLSGSEVGHVNIKKDILDRVANLQMIKDYIIALRANARQWSANTKTRSQVNHSGQKPHPQKGTGRARQGYLGATQYKGGGRPKGPKTKFDQHVKINRKEKKAAIRHLFIEKIQNKTLIVLENGSLKGPKTKKVADFLKGKALFGKSVLFLGEHVNTKKDDFFIKSMRNIPRADFGLVNNISGYDIIAHANIVVLDGAIEDLMKILES